MLQILFLIVYFSVYLHQEANETGALRLAKSKLEKQLDELTWRLHLEKKIRVLLPEKKNNVMEGLCVVNLNPSIPKVFLNEICFEMPSFIAASHVLL